MKNTKLSKLISEATAGQEAERQGLKHIGWGRYADKSGKVVARSVDGKLVKVGSQKTSTGNDKVRRAAPPPGSPPDDPRSPQKGYKGYKGVRSTNPAAQKAYISPSKSAPTTATKSISNPSQQPPEDGHSRAMMLNDPDFDWSKLDRTLRSANSAKKDRIRISVDQKLADWSEKNIDQAERMYGRNIPIERFSELVGIPVNALIVAGTHTDWESSIIYDPKTKTVHIVDPDEM